jgi:outer membrane protein assembly factor BamB
MLRSVNEPRLSVGDDPLRSSALRALGCLGAILLVGLPAAARATTHSAYAAAPVARTPDWPHLLLNATHTSEEADTKLEASAAPTTGINWMSPLRAADLGSPVAAFNKVLNKTVVYVGDERGDVIAYDEATGLNVWSTSVGYGDSERSTPLVAPDGTVWVATAYGSTVYKLNGATGAIECSVVEPVNMDASINYAVPPGGVPSIFLATNDGTAISGPTVAIAEANCKTIWSFIGYLQIAGAWVEPAYGVNAAGRGMIFEGTADPDSTLYALDANTGALIWHFSVYNPPPGNYDIGSAATVSPPGNNGFADGVVYQESKYGIIYALDMATGAEIWETNFGKLSRGDLAGRSSPALDGNTLVFGMGDGAIALNATTGAVLWHFRDPATAEVLSSPAVIGPTGNQIVTFGDASGLFHVLALSTGQELYSYQTGGYITSSPAVIDHHILIDSTDGFLYDFALNGGNVALPTTAISSPTQGQQLPNPNGNLTIVGSAADASGLRGVDVSVQSGGPSGPWYNASTGTWVLGPIANRVAVAKPEAKQSAWSFAFPIPAPGASYQVFANAVDTHGETDRTGVEPTFVVQPSLTEPTITPSAALVAPGATFSVSGNAFKPGETVVYTLQGATVGTAQANGRGRVPSIPITVSTGAAFGLTNLTATGQSSGDTTTAPITITNLWTQSGFGPAHTSFEPNDVVFAHTLAVGRGWARPAWSFTSGAAIDASPAVVAGSAYVGNDAGQMFAVDTISGAPFWMYTSPTGAPIHASPAVDVNAGLVVFGDDSGTLYTIAAATGKPIGSAALDGVPTAPSIVNGQIYVGTDAGSVIDLAESTGSPVWSVSLGSAVHSAPAVDAAKSLVFIGDDAGALTALNATTGAAVWTVQTGGAISAPPAVYGGNVDVGSADGKFYVVNETTGAIKAKYAAGSPITAGASVAIDSSIAFGTAHGNMYDIADTGQLIWQRTLQGPIVGVGGAPDVPWYEMANGYIGASKTDQGGNEVYSYFTGRELSTAPTVIDGAAFVGAGNGTLYAFTPFGAAPKARRVHAAVAAHMRAHPPARWTNAVSLRSAAVLARSFEPFGTREFPLHLDRSIARAVPATGIVWHGGLTQTAPRSYLIYWAANGTGSAVDLSAGTSAVGAGSTLAGSAIDTSPYPQHFDDAAVVRVVAREIARNRWSVDRNTRVFVLMASGATASGAGFCAYHSAFDLDGKLASPVPYALVPQQDAPGSCGTLAAVLVREGAELRTDPLGNGWHDAYGNEPLQ